MRSRSGDRGSVTAEFAIALPAVALVLACCLSGLQLAAQQVRLQDAAGLTARAAARGDGTAIAGRLAPGAAVTHWSDAGLECVRLTLPAEGVLPITLTAAGCALGGGR
jgi:hypothetical protein